MIAWSVMAATADSRPAGMAAARSRRADSTDSSSQAAASGSVPELISPSAWARRIRSARCAATARIASRAGSLSAGSAVKAVASANSTP
ncbi:MAG: hypothetical protein WBF20_05265 [Trebonia sp.]|uniref:hypothetical protein n=1 Tax=Trebonia sp. TaxID=2767075 RepID=UPI003BDE1049